MKRIQHRILRFRRNILPFLTIGALLMSVSCKKEKKSEGEQTMPVTVAEVISDSVTITKYFPGTLEAEKNVDIVGRVNGTLLRKLYKDGQYVSQGQPLFTIESSTYRNAANEAQAQLANAKSAYAYASKHYEAMKKALLSDAVAEMEVLQAKSAMEQAAAQIRNAQAALSDANIKIGYCTVRAPFSGYISTPTLDPGAYVGGEMSPVKLASLYDNSSLYVVFNINDKEYIDIFANGDKKEINVDMQRLPLKFTDRLTHDYTAALSYQAPTVDATTGTLKLRATVKNPYNELKNGMYAQVVVPTGIEPQALLVKDASISTDQLGQYVYVVDKENRVEHRTIETGELYHDSLRIVNKGLKPGDRYVTTALLKVRPGMKVKPVLQKEK